MISRILYTFFMFLAFYGYSHANDTIQARKFIVEANRLYNLATDEGDSLALIKCEQVVKALNTSYRHSPLLAEAYFLSAVIHSLHEHYEPSIINYRKSLYIRKPTPSIDLLEVYRGIGDAFYYTYRYDSALFYYKLSEPLLKQFPNYAQAVLILNTTGAIYNEKGDYLQAINYFKHGIQLTKVDRFLVMLYLNLSDVYRKMKEYNKALEALEKATLHGKKDSNLHIVQHNIGRVYLEKRDYEKALKYLSLANKTYKNSKVTSSEFEIKLNNNLASTYFRLGNDSLALSYYDKAIFIANNRKLLSLAHAYKGKGLVYSSEGRFFEAINNYQKAIQVLKFDDHNSISDTYLLSTLASKADALNRIGKEDDALQTYKQALSLAERIRRGYDSDEMKLFFTETAYPIYEKAISIAFQLYVTKGQETYKQLIFLLIEKSKAAVLAEAIRSGRIKGYAGIPQALLVQEKSIKVKIASINSQLVEAKSTQVTKLRGQLRELEIELGKLSKTFEKYPDYFKLKYDTSTVSIEHAQQVIKSNVAILEYFKGGDAWYAVVITAENFEVVKLKVDDSALDELRVALYEYQELDTYAGNEVAHKLYNQLFKPLLPYMKEVKRLVIVPDGELNYIPFDVLVPNIGTKRYLLHDYAVSRSPSVQLFLEAQQRLISLSPTILAFAPFISSKTSNFSVLPHSKEEVDSITTLIPGRIFYDSTANKQTFLDLYQNYEIIHLSTHGVAGKEPFIAFYEGIPLYDHELYNLNMEKTNLLVLSACETGNGQLATGEGLISLARAFLYAKCPAVVTTLWRTDDLTSQRIITNFYSFLRQGYTKDEALQKAKIAYLESATIFKDLYYPPYWSNFIIIGNTESLYSNENSDGYWIVGLLSVLVISVLVWFKLRGRK